jgi:hypothetical protein
MKGLDMSHEPQIQARAALDTWDTPPGYLTDPSQEPDPAKLETDVAFLISEA